MPTPIDIVSVAYNEANSIAKEIATWRVLALSAGFQPTIIIAEDGSTDGTTEILSILHEQREIIHEYSPQRRGYKQALLAGFRRTTAQRVLFLDSGNKFEENDIIRILKSAESADCILGNRKRRSDSRMRRILSKLYTLFCKFYFREISSKDIDSGIRCYSRNIIDSVILKPLIFPELIGSEIMIRTEKLGFSVLNIDISYKGRIGSSRGLPNREIPKKAIEVLRLTSSLKKEIAAIKPRVGM